MKKKVLKSLLNILLAVLIVSTSYMILISNFKTSALDLDLYSDYYSKYGTYERFDDHNLLMHETVGLIEYLESGNGTIQSDFFNQKEKIHLVEVRAIFSRLFSMLNITFFISVVSMIGFLICAWQYTRKGNIESDAKYLKSILSRLVIGIGAVVAGLSLLLLISTLMFTQFFLGFHKVAFATDTWMLNPATDNLINMFPELFFRDMFIRIVLINLGFGALTLLIGILLRDCRKM